jgi:hypothetical protein
VKGCEIEFVIVSRSELLAIRLVRRFFCKRASASALGFFYVEVGEGESGAIA